MNETNHFRLSHYGKLAAIIGIAICSTTSASAADIVSANNQQTQVSQKNGVDIVNIATPNTHGLSHNQYNQFNVSKEGAVLNNALQAGNSQLAGHLASNPNLQRNPAKIILNEVVQNNPSLLLGQQEVFGIAADYVLANPNGITCDGCGFINTPRASLVVGQPTVSDEGSLQGFDIHQTDAAAVIKNQVQGEHVLDIIAPKLDINADIKAEDAINAVSGQGQVNYQDLSVSQKSNPDSHMVLDGRVLGSMQANRIRVHLGNEQAQDIVGADLLAKESLNIDDTGALAINAKHATGDKVSIYAKDLYINGRKASRHVEGAEHSAKVGHGVTHTTQEITQEEAFAPTQIDAKEVSLAADRHHNLTGIKVNADNLSISGTDVSFAGAKTTHETTTIDKRSKQLWLNSTEISQSEQQLHQSELNIKNKATIHAGNSLNLKGLSLNSAEADLSGGKELHISGDSTQKITRNLNQKRNETAKLQTGHTTQEQQTEEYHASKIVTKNLKVSGNDVQVKGVQITADNASINADNVLDITPETTVDQTKHENQFTYWGGIGGGEKHLDNQDNETTHSSVIDVKHLSLVGKNGVNIAAGQISSDTDVSINNDQGTVNITHAENHSSTLKYDQKNGAFSIPVNTSKVSHAENIAVSSNIQADGDTSVSGQNIHVQGSTLSANNALNIHGKDSVNTDTAESQTIDKKRTYQGGPTGYIKLAGKDLGVHAIAGVRWDNTVVHSTEANNVATGTHLNGANVNVTTNGSANLSGTQIHSQGTTTISGKQIALQAADHVTHSKSEKVNNSSVDTHISLGLKKVEAGLDIDVAQKNHESAEHQAIVSDIQSGGSINIHAQDTLTNQGTHLDSPDQINLSGKTISNIAAHNKQEDHSVDGKGYFSLAVYGKTAPAVGGKVSISGEGNGNKTIDTQSQVTTLQAKNINLHGQDAVLDQGTQYLSKKIDIKSKNYLGQEAANSHVSTTNEGHGSLNVEAYTTTGQDVSMDIGASGDYKHTQEGKKEAQKGVIKANDVHIAADNVVSANDIHAQSLHLDGKNVSLVQANNHDWKKVGGAELGGELGVNMTVPTDTANVPKVSVNAGIEYLDNQNSQAVETKINADNMSINAQNHASVLGTDIAAKELSVQSAKAEIGAGQDHHRAVGVTLKGGVDLDLDTDENPGKVNDANVSGTFAVINETAHQAHSNHVVANNVDVQGHDAGVQLHGVNVDAHSVNLQSDHGTVAILADENEVHKGNFSTEDHVNGILSMKDSVDLGAKFQIDSEHSHTYEMGHVQANDLNITSGKDTTLQGNFETGSLNVNAGGVVNIQSVQDHKRVFQTGAELNVSGSPVKFDKDTTVKDVIKAVKADYDNDTTLGMSVDGSANLLLDNADTTKKTQINTQNLNVHSQSNIINIHAANVQANSGPYFGSANVHTTTNKDFHHFVSASIEGHNPHLKDVAHDLTQGQFNIPIKVNGKSEWSQPKLIGFNINLK